MPLLADAGAAIAEALAAPIGAPPLAELARGRRNACILICDITRPVPNGLFLAPLIRALLDAGVRARASRPGRDRPASPQRGRRARRAGGRSLGDGDRPVENHFARDDDDHVAARPHAARGTV